MFVVWTVYAFLVAFVVATPPTSLIPCLSVLTDLERIDSSLLYTGRLNRLYLESAELDPPCEGSVSFADTQQI